MVAAQGHAVGAAPAVERRHGEAAAAEREAALGRREHAEQRRGAHQPFREDEATRVGVAVGEGERLGEQQRRPRDAEAEQLRAQAVLLLLLPPPPVPAPVPVTEAGHLLDHPRRRVRVVPHDPLLQREQFGRDAGEVGVGTGTTHQMLDETATSSRSAASRGRG